MANADFVISTATIHRTARAHPLPGSASFAVLNEAFAFIGLPLRALFTCK
jgi:hypothetical protein